jgi:chorismate mutase
LALIKTMTMIDTVLGDIRQEIDRIDDQIHDLLIERAGLIEEISRRKNAAQSPVVHPLREAAILRRLAARHQGRFPFAAVTRIWREIISTSALLQQPISVAVYAPADIPGPWDLARDHYGSQVPMTPYRSTGQIIRALSDGSVSIGVVPMPAENETDPWWPHIRSRDPASPRIVARLSFSKGGNARANGDVLAIAANAPDLGQFDRALVAIEVPMETSRTRLLASLGAIGLRGVILAFEGGGDGSILALAELEGPVAWQDPRFAALSSQLGALSDIYHLGGYAEKLVTAVV